MFVFLVQGFESETMSNSSSVVSETIKKDSCAEQNVKKCETACSNEILNNSVIQSSEITLDSSGDQSKYLKMSDVDEYEEGFASDEDLSDYLGEVVDIHRTGAKCVSGEDTKLPGAKYHTLGAIRTKPGVYLCIVWPGTIVLSSVQSTLCISVCMQS